MQQSPDIFGSRMKTFIFDEIKIFMEVKPYIWIIGP